MPAESLTQVFDERGEPTGAERRDYIQRNGLWHGIVGVWVVDAEGNMLVQKRQLGRGLDDEKLDSSASGHVDPGERFEEAGTREIKEELGVDLAENQLEQIAYFQSESTNGDKILRRFTKVFRAQVGREAIKLSVDHNELGGVEWLSANDVEELVARHPDRTVPGFVIAWYLSRQLPLPESVVADNNVRVMGPVQAE